MSTQDTPVIDKPAVSSEAKVNDVALFTDDKTPATPPAPEETVKTPEAEGKKPEAESGEDGTKKTEEAGTDPAPKVPETKVETPVELELKIVDGSGLAQKDVDEVTTFAKDNNLSQEAAQQLLDSRAAQFSEFQANQQEQVKIQQAKWLDEVKADKEIGGDKLAQTIALAAMPIAKYASPGLKKMLNDSGLGNHPEVIKMFARIGKTMQPDTHVDAPRNAAADAPKENYEYLYGEDKK